MTQSGRRSRSPLWPLFLGIQLIQGFLHYIHTLFHHGFDLALLVVRQKVSNPYDPACTADSVKNLHRRVVVRCAGAQTNLLATSSRSTIGSRTSMPLANVTTLASDSRRVAITNPGTSRVCRAPTSRIAAQTSSGSAVVSISLRIDAIGSSLLVSRHPGP